MEITKKMAAAISAVYNLFKNRGRDACNAGCSSRQRPVARIADVGYECSA
jgi:hypothetical protein